MKKPINTILFYLISVLFLYCIYDSIQHIRSEIYHRNGYIKKERGYPKFANRDFKKATQLAPWENHYQLQLAKSYEDTAKKHPKQKILQEVCLELQNYLRQENQKIVQL